MIRKSAAMTVVLFFIFVLFLAISSVWASGGEEGSRSAGAVWSAPINLIKGNIGSPMRPAVSADGTRVVYVNDPLGSADTAKEIKIVEYAGAKWGAPRVLATNGINDTGNFIWMPRWTYPVISGDGNTIAYLGYTASSAKNQIYIIDRGATGVWGTPYVLPTGFGNHHYWMEISSDGNTVAYTDYPDPFSSSPTAYVSTRANGIWGSPVAVSGPDAPYLLSMNGDGTKLAWGQNNRLVFTEKVGGTWKTPEWLTSPEISTTYYYIVDYPRILPDGSAIFYRKTKTVESGTASVETELNHYVIRRTGSGWAAPEKVNPVVVPPNIYLDGAAAVNAAGTRLVYTRGYIKDDVMHSSLLESAEYANGKWTASVITRASDWIWFDMNPRLTPDGTKLVYQGPMPDYFGATAIWMKKTSPPPSYTLSVKKAGTGTGTIASVPAGINCGADCGEQFAKGTEVTLTATALPKSTFVRWTGCVAGSKSPEVCKVTMNTNKVVTATFLSYALLVKRQGTGAGTITSVPQGINCTGSGPGCTDKYAKDTPVTLTAAADAKSTLMGWTNCKAGASPTECTVTMNANKVVTATFATFTLVVGKQGAGVGTITSVPAGINCTGVGAGCADHYAKDTPVTLTATAGAKSTFAGWVGPACKVDTKDPTKCTVAMSANRAVSAVFRKTK